MKNTDFNELAKRAYENAKLRGFHKEKHTDAHYMMLIACELAEAVEADRKGQRADRKTYNFLLQEYGDPVFKHLFDVHIKDTVEDELADVVIRLLDYVGAKGLNIPDGFISEESINKECDDECREWFKGRSFADVIFTSCLNDLDSAIGIPEEKIYAIFVIAEIYGIDLMWHIKEKMEYNELREYMHGKRY